MLSIALNEQGYAEYADAIANKGGIVTDVLNRQFIFSHFHQGVFHFRGRNFSEQQFIQLWDDCCIDGKPSTAFLVCCEPGKLSAATLKGRLITLTHVLSTFSNKECIVETRLEKSSSGFYYTLLIEEK